MTHSFDTEVAEKVGVNAAIIYANIVYWCLKNKANNDNYYDENYWTYNSVKAWKELFPYLGESQIKTALKRLEESGLILVGNYNSDKYNHTKWFSPIRLGGNSQSTLGGNSQSTITNNKPDTYGAFILELKKKAPIPSKVTKTKEGAKLFKKVEDSNQLICDYVDYQKDNKNYSIRITDYIENYLAENAETGGFDFERYNK